MENAEPVSLTLTKITPNPRSGGVRNDLSDPDNLHKTVRNLLPEEVANRQQANLLHRVEETPDGPVILVQSTVPLSRERLKERESGRTPYALGIQQKDLTPLLSWIVEGKQFSYRIHVNPHATVRGAEGILREAESLSGNRREAFLRKAREARERRRGVCVPLFGERAVEWWERTAERSGMVVQTVTTSDVPRLSALSKTRSIGLRAMAVEGVATVANEERLRNSLVTGIGKGKAFGLGLLTLSL